MKPFDFRQEVWRSRIPNHSLCASLTWCAGINALLFIFFIIIFPGTAMAERYIDIPSSELISVSLKAPAGPLRMGEVPMFTGTIINRSTKTLKGLVVYLSLVSLLPGHEHPVDLEDWSAQKAIRIASLTPGQESDHEWKMRLIKAGPFGAALTIVDPESNQPRISPLAIFSIAPKPTVISGRIFPVIIGVPLFLAGLFLVLYRTRR